MRAVFFGLGADGTVGANKNSIKIIGEETDNWAQGYFVYDSKKSGAVTISHLRFGPAPIRAPYLVSRASFVACHQFSFLDRYDVLECAEPGGVFLLNAPHPADEVWDELPFEVQEQIVEKRLRFFVIDAYAVAKAAGMGTRINTIMQTCFFAISGVLPRDEAIAQHQARDREDLQRSAAPRSCSGISRRSMRRSPISQRWPCRRRRPPRVACRRWCRTGARLRQARHRGDAGEPRRSAAGQRVPDRRHLADRHLEVGEAQHRGRDPGLGRGAVHPVQQVRARLSACRDSRQGLRARCAG